MLIYENIFHEINNKIYSELLIIIKFNVVKIKIITTN